MSAEHIIQAAINLAASKSVSVRFIREGGLWQEIRADDTSNYVKRGGLFVPKDAEGDTYGYSWAPSFVLPYFGHSDVGATVKQERSDTEIIGWRVWTLLTEDGVELHSFSHDTAWPGPMLRADKLPDVGNASGIYAMQDRAALRGQLEADSPYASVYGTVALSGTVVEGTSGYRGEVAVIRSLYVRRGSFNMNALQIADALSDRYAVTAELDIDPSPSPVDDDEDEN